MQVYKYHVKSVAYVYCMFLLDHVVSLGLLRVSFDTAPYSPHLKSSPQTQSLQRKKCVSATPAPSAAFSIACSTETGQPWYVGCAQHMLTGTSALTEINLEHCPRLHEISLHVSSTPCHRFSWVAIMLS